jgi:hypothetical protein
VHDGDPEFVDPTKSNPIRKVRNFFLYEETTNYRYDRQINLCIIFHYRYRYSIIGIDAEPQGVASFWQNRNRNAMRLRLLRLQTWYRYSTYIDFKNVTNCIRLFLAHSHLHCAVSYKINTGTYKYKPTIFLTFVYFLKMEANFIVG